MVRKGQDRKHRPASGRKSGKSRSLAERDAALAARRQRYRGSQGMCRDEVLAAILAESNMRIRPVVDVEFLRIWLFRLAQAMAAENWEQFLEIARQAARTAIAQRTWAPRRDEILAMPLTLTSISQRTLLYLERDGIRTVHDLLQRDQQSLMRIPQFGAKCLMECREALAKLGLVESSNSLTGRNA